MTGMTHADSFHATDDKADGEPAFHAIDALSTIGNGLLPTNTRYLKKSFGGSSFGGSKTSSYGGSSYKWSGGSNNYRGYGGGESGECDDTCILVIIIVMSLAVLLVVGFFFRKFQEGKRNTDTAQVPSEYNWVMNASTSSVSKEPCSAPGKYTGICHQNGMKQSMEPFDISYEHSGIPNQYVVKGNGEDKVGSFVLRGVWKGNRLGMTKQYLKGTGDPNENHGHQIHMRLAKEKSSGMVINDRPRLEGKYYVRTPQYSGEDHISIWLVEGGALVADSVEVTVADSTEIPPVVGATVATATVSDAPYIDEEIRWSQETAPPVPAKPAMAGVYVPGGQDGGTPIHATVSDAPYIDEEMGNIRPTPSAPPLQETAPPVPTKPAMAGVYVPGGQDGGHTYSVGPGIYAHPTGFGAQAVAYRSSRMLAGVTSRISNRNLVQEKEVDVAIIKSSGDKMQIKLRGTKIVALPGGVLADSDLKVGDKLITINGESILKGSAEVISKLNKASVGSVVNVTVLRPISSRAMR
eukprot:CAMPEP_0197734026 /NCGR_PEP_ID=MMETSP1434-20131217/44209_1 /TAXON_ID=265543 /ORGANISM="Minutocellus polymorphus, Strain CCMP3303" /LENGTH=521 /DNA_ID=CAMNT_0043321431 /DNA_START=137 /DNA_END=1703 /DNA_ORIENTATION=+